MASRSLSDLHPKAREKAMQWIDFCRKLGVDALVYCTYRSAEEQDELYKIGRETAGSIVTNARAGQSLHQYRVAWDAVPLLAGKPQWNDKSSYAKMGTAAEALGIEWAGRWSGKLKETAHFQYVNGLTLKDFQAGKTL